MTSTSRQIWPLALADSRRWDFLTDDLSPVMACLNAPDGPWGLEMVFFRNGTTTVPTNRVTWLEAGSPRPTRISPNHLTDRQMRAILMLNGGMEIPRSICEGMPMELEGGSDGPRWVIMTLTARAAIMSLANLRRHLSGKAVASHIADLSTRPAEELIAAYPDLDPWLQQAATVVHPGTEGLSQHQKLSYEQDLRKDVEAHLARYSLMIPRERGIGLRPDWHIPQQQVDA